MATKLQIDQVEVAMLSLGQAAIGTAYGTPVDVDSIGDRDFDNDGNLVLRPPCVRLRFSGAEYDTLRDNQKLTYGGKLLFDFYVFVENLRDKADERLDTLRLLAVIQDVYAGSRLHLADGFSTEPTELVGVVPMMNEGSIVDQFYAVTFRINGLAQFDGANARFGA